MKKRSLPLLAAACFLSLSVFSQHLPNSILWRISGKDGHHTSYLYGSMHLTDARIFNLGDSLYAAIHHSDGLATELDPSDLLSLTVESFEEQEKSGKHLKELLSDKDYKLYGPLLAKKLNKPIGSITTRDILNHKNKWLKDQYTKGGMSTFLDMYLYEAARRQGKWTGGIEDAADQRGLLSAEESVDKSDVVDVVGKDQNAAVSGELEKMIAVYLKQDLTAIDTMFGNSLDRENVLIKRNHKMAARMDSLSGVRSMVFVVGVAHLPGEEGLIRLLRQKGFDVQPVFSSKRIKPADYPMPDLPQAWETVTDENGFYRTTMPGKAQDIDLYHLFRMKMYFDFLDMNGYCIAAIPSAFKADRMDSLMDIVASKIFEGNGKHPYERITLNGAQGRVYTSGTDIDYKKGYFLLKDGIFYMAYGTAVRGNEKNKKNIDRFLKGLEVLDRKKTDSDLNKMVVHTDSVLAFTISTPGPIKLNANTIAASGHSRLFTCTDLVDGGFYFIGVNEVASDHYILNDSIFFRDLSKTVSGKLKSVDFDSSWVVDDQLVRELHGAVANVDMEMRIRYIDRGNRWYALLAMTPTPGNRSKVNRFFSSFAELDYPVHTWSNTISPDSVFTAWTPAPIEIRPKDSTDGPDIDRKYNSYDSSTAQGFGVVTYHLGTYYWSGSDSAFWAERVHGHIQFSDTLISKKAVSNGEARGWEWVKRGKRSHNYERSRLLLDGDQLYTLLACGPYKELYTANVDHYFESFRFTHPLQSNAYLHSRARQLIDGLMSPDSAVSARAYAYMGQAPFSKNDLPLLYHALEQTSPVMQHSPYRRKLAIFNAIERLKDTSALQFALQHYVLPLLKDSTMAPGFASYLVEFLDSGLLHRDQLLLYRDDIMNYATRITHRSADIGYRDRAIIRLYGRFNDDSSNSLMTRLLGGKDKLLALDALKTLLLNKQPVDSAVLRPIAANRAYRLALYEELEKAGRTNLFPGAYRSQKAFAQSEVDDYATEEDDADEDKISISYINTITRDGKNYLFYKYGNGEAVYLACAGPYDSDPAKFTAPDIGVHVYFRNEFDASKLQEQSDALIKVFERQAH